MLRLLLNFKRFVLWEAIILFVANTYFVETGFELLTGFLCLMKNADSTEISDNCLG